MSFITKIGAFLTKVWKSLKDNGAHVAVTITEEVKTVLDSGAVGWLATIIEKLFPTIGTLPEELVKDLKAVIIKVLAAELAVEGLPENPTEADILAFEQKLMTAFGVVDDKSKLFTTLAAQIFGIFKRHTDAGETWTFFKLADACQEAYEDYLKDLQEASAEAAA